MPKTVLVADDNRIVRHALRQIFEGDTDYDLCAEAENGEEAITLANMHRPDLIILDFSMPVMNGLDAARKLKVAMPDTPIILFTVHENHFTSVVKDLPVDMVVSKGDVNLMSYVRRLAPA